MPFTSMIVGGRVRQETAKRDVLTIQPSKILGVAKFSFDHQAIPSLVWQYLRLCPLFGVQ